MNFLVGYNLAVTFKSINIEYIWIKKFFIIEVQLYNDVPTSTFSPESTSFGNLLSFPYFPLPLRQRNVFFLPPPPTPKIYILWFTILLLIGYHACYFTFFQQLFLVQIWSNYFPLSSLMLKYPLPWNTPRPQSWIPYWGPVLLFLFYCLWL